MYCFSELFCKVEMMFLVLLVLQFCNFFPFSSVEKIFCFIVFAFLVAK